MFKLNKSTQIVNIATQICDVNVATQIYDVSIATQIYDVSIATQIPKALIIYHIIFINSLCKYYLCFSWST